MNRLSYFTFLVVAGLSAAQAQTATTDLRPQIIDPAPGQKVYVSKVSDNGRWAVTQFGSEVDGTIAPSGGMIINIDNPSQNTVISHTSGLSGVSDVTDDGNIAVGECTGRPAYWSRSTGEWTKLSIPIGYSSGRLNAVTPDGRIAVGDAYPVDEWTFTPVVYDLTTGKRISVTNLPTRDRSGVSQGQNSFIDISADGRYILGQVSQSYPADLLVYVYDLQQQTYRIIGFDEPTTGKYWEPWVKNLDRVEASSALSPDGRYVSGMAYIYPEIDGVMSNNEVCVSYLYDVTTDQFTIYNGDADNDIGAFAVTNSGTVLAGSPAENPYSTFMIRHGRYFYSLEQVMRQVYGVADFVTNAGLSCSGKPCSVSADGMTIASLTGTDRSYILRLREPLTAACEKVNLLADYTCTPASGSVFSTLRTVTLAFDRSVSVAGLASSVKLLDSTGKSVANALSVKADKNKVNVGFQSRALKAGETYTIRLPKGYITVAGDNTKSSDEITIAFTGRREGAVALTGVYPADGAALAMLDATSNPVMFSFDAAIAAAPNATGFLYRNDETAPVCALPLSASGNMAMAYPASGQHLYKNNHYRVVIPAGAFTDISGAGPSEEITLHYTGTYVREVQSDSKYIFNENCNSLDNFLFYEGDRLNPSNVAASWGFTADTTPWFVTRDSDTSTDMALTSHSMYFPAGQSNDWVATPQLFIPDENCVLAFDSQSYLASKQDRLKVIVLAAEDIYGELTTAVVNRFLTEGKVIYNEVQSPGANEETLAGEWRHNSLSLAEFAGKQIYIAFVNDNYDQSALFLDNIQVMRDVKYGISFDTPLTTVDRDDVAVSGVLQILTDTEEFATFSLTLIDSEGNEVDRFDNSNHTMITSLLRGGDRVEFAFDRPLPLRKGEINDYSVVLRLDAYTFTIARSVKNLLFEPVQRVVLEEYTGSGCGNCPQGIRAIENLEHLYGNRFIPLTIRCYGGDVLGSGMTPYSDFLGMKAAPSGRINRGVIGSPMIAVGEDYRFTGEGITMPDGSDPWVWLDYVQQEMAAGTTTDVTVTPSYNADTKTVSAQVDVRPALNLTAQSLSLFGVVTENNITTYQINYHSTSDDPDFGPWGKGGEYGQATVYPYITRDVVRGCYGNTFNGTGGYLPSNLEAGTTYSATITGPLPSTIADAANADFTVMLIDTNTNRVVNSHRQPLIAPDNEPGAINAADASTLTLLEAPGRIAAAGEGTVTLQLFTLQGVEAASATGTGAATLTAAPGLYLLRATDSRTTLTRKVQIK